MDYSKYLMDNTVTQYHYQLCSTTMSWTTLLLGSAVDLLSPSSQACEVGCVYQKQGNNSQQKQMSKHHTVPSKYIQLLFKTKFKNERNTCGSKKGCM